MLAQMPGYLRLIHGGLMYRAQAYGRAEREMCGQDGLPCEGTPARCAIDVHSLVERLLGAPVRIHVA